MGRFGRCGGYDAGEFGACYPGEGRLVLVFSGYLEEVEEVGAAGVDVDCVLVGFGGRVGECGDKEFGGSLEGSVLVCWRRGVVLEGLLTFTNSFSWMAFILDC